MDYDLKWLVGTYQMFKTSETYTTIYENNISFFFCTNITILNPKMK